MDFAPDLFAGTADYYARYRLPYPQPMIDELRARAGLDGTGRLLDLACGPGTVTLRFAPFVGDVVAVDQEPDMIERGRELAGDLGIGNISWRVGRAEDLVFPAGSLRMVTVGNAFHRLDRAVIAELVKGWLAPEGSLALVYTGVFAGGTEDWHHVVNDLVKKWADPPESRGAAPRPQVLTNAEILRAAGFRDVDERDFPAPHVWTVEEVVGHLYSTSFASRAAFGDRVEAYEAELRQALLDYDDSGQYTDTISFAYTFAKGVALGLSERTVRAGTPSAP